MIGSLRRHVTFLRRTPTLAPTKRTKGAYALPRHHRAGPHRRGHRRLRGFSRRRSRRSGRAADHSEPERTGRVSVVQPDLRGHAAEPLGAELAMTLRDRLRTLFPEASSRSLKAWLESGRVTVNDATVRDGRLVLGAADRVSLGPSLGVPFPSELGHVYEDEEVVVIDKPPGWLTI